MLDPENLSSNSDSTQIFRPGILVVIPADISVLPDPDSSADHQLGYAAPAPSAHRPGLGSVARG